MGANLSPIFLMEFERAIITLQKIVKQCIFYLECVDLTYFFRILGNFLRRIGCQPVTNFPNGIDISDAGDILVGDSHGNQFHVAVYDRRGDLVSQFQCPQVNNQVFIRQCLAMDLFIRKDACLEPNSNCRVRL